MSAHPGPVSGSARKGYRLASDGLLARESGDWAKEKLYYVDHYSDIVNRAMKNKWVDRSFVDLMAGCGRNILASSPEEFDGSPILALKSTTPFTRVVLVERDDELRAALRQRVAAIGAAADFVVGDCNDPVVIDSIRALVPMSSLAVVFVDMLGLDVSFATLSALTYRRNMDLAITFQVNDLTRNVPLVLRGKADRTRLDTFFGTPDWEPVARRERRGRDLAADLTDFYCERLATIGYAHVAQLHVLMKNKQNAPLYRLVLAGRHERAQEFFQKISKIEYSGQRGLF